MKFLVSLLLLGLAVASHAAVAKGPASRSNLYLGYVSPGDRLLYRDTLARHAIQNTIQYQDLVYRGNASVRIAAIQAVEMGSTNYATPWILEGGLEYNYATVRVQSASGWGFYYIVEIWGHEEGYPYKQGIANAIQLEDSVYRGNVTTRISAIQATELGGPQYASVWVVQGGVGYNNATVRVQSMVGYGFYYVIDIWGR